jgi:hypothetical protein
MFQQSFLFNKREVFSLADKVGHHIIRLALLACLGKMVQTTIHHLHRDVPEGALQALGHAIGQVNEHGVKQPGSPHLQLDAIDRTSIEVSQSQQAFDDVEGVLNGMITNDKFCVTRWGELQLSWWRRPLRLRG